MASGDLTPVSVSEGSFLLAFPGRSEFDANRAAVSLAKRVSKRRVRGVLDTIPGARTLFVLFDPRVRDTAGLVRLLARLARESETSAPTHRLVRIPVAYGGRGGPDLQEVGSELGLDALDVGRRHAGGEYRVAFLGFSPGFPYLTGLPPELAVPRLATPRPRVLPGSVAIAGEYSAIYPSETPGGWRLIGRTAASLFDPAADPPALLAPGDRVAFEPIAEEELARRLSERRAGEPRGNTGADGEVLFEVMTPGAFTSIQGAPRYGLGGSGVPAGGAMDTDALAEGNARVGNDPGAAALEVTLSGPELLLRTDAILAISGADLDAAWNGEAAPLGRAFPARTGDRITFGARRLGARAYLCVAGGLVERLPAETTRRLARGDRILRSRRVPSPAAASGTASRMPAEGAVSLRVVPGPQADVLGPASEERLFSASYRVSPESDRRGIRLEGPALDLRRAPDVAPEGTALGSIQVPGDGLPIVLGPDRPVTGGYAKVATVIARDWPLLAQSPPGTAVRFRPVALEEAMEELRGS